MTNQVSFTPERALSSIAAASPGAKARFYETGTTTAATVYADVAGTTVLAQPVTANAAGVFPQVFCDGTVAVKAVVTAADDTALFTVDPCLLTPTESGSASQVSVVPFTGITATNVQAALEAIQDNISDQTTNVQTVVQTAGSGNAYTMAAASTITDYAQGQRFVIRPNHTNTGAATINIDGKGAKAIARYDQTSIAALRPGDLAVGDIAEIAYDGTRFLLMANNRRPALEPLDADEITGATLSEIRAEIPGEFSGFVMEVDGFLPGTNGAQLNMQLGTGTLASPSWITSYQNIFSGATDNAVSGDSGTFSALAASISASSTATNTNYSHMRVSGMNGSGPAHFLAQMGGVNNNGALLVLSRYGQDTSDANRTLMQIFPSTGTIAAIRYRLFGVRPF